MLINCSVYQEGVFLKSIEKGQISKFLKKDNCVVWVALKDADTKELLEMKNQFDLPDLAVEDAQHGHQVPKIEEYNNSLFAILKLPEIQGDDLLTGELNIFLGKNYVLSIRNKSTQHLWHIREKLENHPQLLELGSGIIFYALIDGVVDLYFPILYVLENELDQIEENIFNQQASRTLIIKLYNLKNKVTQLRHAIAPLIEDLAKMQGKERAPFLLDGLQNYFRDVGDHLDRMLTSIDSIRETVNTVMHVNISLIAVEDSQINKRLAAWAGIFAVATALLGIWGMNFEAMPELRWRWGYPSAMLIIVVVCGYLYYKFKKSGWL
ncbi:MAG: magnesium/cobalt transporter CorA [SAR324 cluster bacterium]|nr:magnesium/cobalt transporter CorA [SAR324 cluster bacterium]